MVKSNINFKLDLWLIERTTVMVTSLEAPTWGITK